MWVLANTPDWDALEVCGITTGIYESISGGRNLSHALPVQGDVTLEWQPHYVWHVGSPLAHCNSIGSLVSKTKPNTGVKAACGEPDSDLDARQLLTTCPLGLDCWRCPGQNLNKEKRLSASMQPGTNLPHGLWIALTTAVYESRLKTLLFSSAFN